MKLLKHLSLLSIAFGSILPVSANKYQFDNYIFDQSEREQNIYEPKDKLDEYIIKWATYSTKFVPFMNNGSEGNEYTNFMANDVKGLLVNSGIDFVNATANSNIQKITFFAQTSVNVSGGTDYDTSFSINS